MSKKRCFELLVSIAFLSCQISTVCAVASESTVSRAALVRHWAGDLPVLFEENQGQVRPDVKYLTRGNNHVLFFTASKPAWSFFGASEGSQVSHTGSSQEFESPRVITLELLGMSPGARLTAENKAPSRTSYLRGSDPSRWKTDIPSYRRVRYEEIYSGIDLVFYGSQNRLEYDFVVSPGADPDGIRWKFEGIDSIRIDSEGELVLTTSLGELRHLAPRAYQKIEGQTREIGSRYQLQPEGVVSFEIDPYDKTQLLTIDPVLVYSTYLGGSNGEVPGGVTADPEGNVYIAGNTGSLDFPTRNAYQEDFAGGGTPNGDIFVTKVDASGSFIIYSTYIGGAGTDVGHGIAIDSQGRALVTGTTFSGNFPSTSGSFQTFCSGLCPFVFRLEADGAELSYSTFVGRGQGTAIAVDSLGQAVITGQTSSSDFPVKDAFQPEKGGGADAFVSKLNAAGTGLIFSTFLGGTGNDNLIGKQGIATDPDGNVYVTGRTESVDFPVKNPVQNSHQGENDAFLAKLTPQGQLVHSTYLGGSLDDEGQGVHADAAGNAYVVGNTKSQNFPTEKAFQPSYGGGVAVGDAFVAKIGPGGGNLVFSTYLGGQLGDTANDISVDEMGRPVVVGSGASNFPVRHSLRDMDGGSDNYVAKFTEDGSDLVYSTPIGGGDPDVFVTTSGTQVFVAGNISSGNFPVLNAMQPRSEGSTEVFLTRISDAGTLYFAQFANGLGAVSDILLTGSSAISTASAKVTIRDNDGDLLPTNVVVTDNVGNSTAHSQVSELNVDVPPLGLVKIASDGAGALTAGSVTVDFDMPIGGLIRFTLSPFGTAGVPASELVRGFISPVRKTAINTGVAIYNPEDKQIGLTMRLRDLAGDEIPGGLKSTAIGAHEHISIFIDQLFPNADLTDFEGTITVQTSSGNALFTATVLELGAQPGEFTTLPVTPIP